MRTDTNKNWLLLSPPMARLWALEQAAAAAHSRANEPTRTKPTAGPKGGLLTAALKAFDSIRV